MGENRTWREASFDLVFGSESKAAKAFDAMLLFAIAASVAVVLVESAQDSGSGLHMRLRVVELAFTILFTVEYAVRLWCHPRPLRYALSFYGLVDFIAILPTYLALLVPGWENLAVLRALRVVRVFRVFSIGRYSRAATLVASAVAASRHKILVFAAGILLLALIAGTLLYTVEGPGNGFHSIPASIYWAIVTLTTVGHAEVMPTTPLGHILAAIIMVLGYGVVAIPVGIVSSEIVAARRVRDEVLGGEEDGFLEFKSSVFVSLQNPSVPERVLVEASLLKPVAGFLNAKGGRLVIGVDDEGTVLGIQADLDAKEWDADRYVNTLTQKILSELGGQAAAMTEISVESLPEGTVCSVEVLASADPVYLRTPKNAHAFYVRINNTTQELSGPDMVRYINRRWH